MQPLALSAFTLVSAIGRGMAESTRALLEERSGLRPCDLAWAPLNTYIGRVDGVEDAPVAGELSAFDCRNNRLAQMALRADGFEDAVAALAGRYGPDRVAVILGTSTSGIGASEDAFARRDPATGALPASFDYDHTHDYFSLSDFVRRYLGLHGPVMAVSTACSSSAKTFVDAAQMIEADLCDAAIVGGADSLCLMTLKGFASLGLTSTEPCRPCDANRSGISIGESAGFAIIEPVARAPSAAVAFLGYGESSDAYHMSAPHPEGAGAVRAMRDALKASDLQPGDIDYINLHGTGSASNDQAEDIAVSSLFGAGVPCSSTKGWTGHTLGSAGITEALLCCLCIGEGVIPANLNMRQPDPAMKSRIVRRSMRAPVDRVISNSFGFGGNNCTIVLGRAP